MELLSDDTLKISDMISLKEKDDMNEFLNLIDLNEMLFNVLTENNKVYVNKYSDVNYF